MRQVAIPKDQTMTSSMPADRINTGTRTFEQLKAETLHRAECNLQPLGGVHPEDARDAMAAFTTPSRDAWAGAWRQVGHRFLEQAHAVASSNAAAACDLYLRAWHNFHIGRWPTENAPQKQQAYDDALAAFSAYGRLLDPPLDTVRIPFEGKEIVAYLRLPRETRPAPVVLAVSGLDSRKEDFGAGSDPYLRAGLGIVAVDQPGTGQAPIKVDLNSERMLSAVLDYLATRPEVDCTRIVMQSRSWSGYYAAVLAVTEKARLRGAVMHGGPIHAYFQREWQEPRLDTPEYLFDLAEARMAIYPNVTTREEFFAFTPRLSLVARGLIDQPSAPMLLINGACDTQVPIDDLFLLMRHGSPKEAWINPSGGHMGRSPEFPSPAIARQVVLPWILRAMRGDVLQAKG
jgi:pimeloyl-ACP methyl ester carboxylesterase